MYYLYTLGLDRVLRKVTDERDTHICRVTKSAISNVAREISSRNPLVCYTVDRDANLDNTLDGKKYVPDGNTAMEPRVRTFG